MLSHEAFLHRLALLDVEFPKKWPMSFQHYQCIMQPRGHQFEAVGLLQAVLQVLAQFSARCFVLILFGFVEAARHFDYVISPVRTAEDRGSTACFDSAGAGRP